MKKKPIKVKKTQAVRDAELVNLKLKIRMCRQQASYSQEDMAEALGVHLNTYSNYENKNCKGLISLPRLYDICHALDVQIGNIFPDNTLSEVEIEENNQLEAYLRKAIGHADKMRTRSNRYG